MAEERSMKFSFVLQDIVSGKKLFVDSITDLGEIGTKRHIIVRKDDIRTRHQVTVLERKIINYT